MFQDHVDYLIGQCVWRGLEKGILDMLNYFNFLNFEILRGSAFSEDLRFVERGVLHDQVQVMIDCLGIAVLFHR